MIPWADTFSKLNFDGFTVKASEGCRRHTLEKMTVRAAIRAVRAIAPHGPDEATHRNNKCLLRKDSPERGSSLAERKHASGPS